MDLNRATLLGRLTRDPEVRTTPTGKTVANITIATGRVWTDQSGVKQEKSEFHNCVLWGKLADIAGQYLAKGRRVYAEGRLETRDWVGKDDNVKRYRTEIIIDNFIMLDSPRSASASTGASDNVPPPPVDMGGDEEIKVEDIPF
ncbi:single-stranded DNA-binding protein [Patescibacteria group bacterium]|nr:single-stranded DNA-binding protein [Patescibacteria group bacterium]